MRDHGVRVPDDIAVIGWDDIEECSYATPTLSSIAPDKIGIARLAVDLLLDRISGEPLGVTEVTAGFTINARESTAAPGTTAARESTAAPGSRAITGRPSPASGA